MTTPKTFTERPQIVRLVLANADATIIMRGVKLAIDRLNSEARAGQNVSVTRAAWLKVLKQLEAQCMSTQ